ncbi:MAG: hypothetical protein ACRECT_00235 [Thermoplasmata archaeon]
MIIVVVLIAAGSIGYYELVPKTTPAACASASGSVSGAYAGGFTHGCVVTFQYTGNYQCTPGLSTLFPGDANATNATKETTCAVGAANQTAVNQVPEWILVPAFAGLSIFGVSALGSTARGFPTFNSSTILTDCGGGGSPTACPDHPTYIYSPAFTAVELHLGLKNGYGGLPPGVLPTPAHDHLINTSSTYPNVPWGTIAVLVFDPNIFPDRATGTCAASVASNLSSPTGNCLNSLAALERALTTPSTAVATANGANPIWQTLGMPPLQVVVPGDLSIPQIDNLDSNLYIPFSVSPGAPPTFPT